MNFSFLKAFYHVAECKSFTLASKKLNLSQPTLSLQVQGLEKCYGLPLIKRHQKRFELTEEGKLVFSYARSIFSMVTDLENAIEDLGARGLKIGSTPTLAHYIMPNIIRVLKEGNPRLKIQLFTGLSEEVLQKVIHYEHHVGLIGWADCPGNVIRKKVAEPKLYFITKDPVLPERIHLKDLAHYPVILPKEGSKTRAYIIGTFKRLNVPLNNCVDCENAQAIKDMVNLGIGGAFFPLYAIEADVLAKKYRKIEILDGLHLTLSLVYLKERRSLDIVKEFLTAAKASAVALR
jgi:LysR family transcriptional regulator, transcriptional activator of the cysJI operon